MALGNAVFLPLPWDHWILCIFSSFFLSVFFFFLSEAAWALRSAFKKIWVSEGILQSCSALIPRVGHEVCTLLPSLSSCSSTNSCRPKCHEVPECNKHVGIGTLSLGYNYLRSDSVLCIIIFWEVLVSKTFEKVLKYILSVPVHKSRKQQ